MKHILLSELPWNWWLSFMNLTRYFEASLETPPIQRANQDFMGVSSLLPFHFGAWDSSSRFFDARPVHCWSSHRYKSEFSLTSQKDCISFELTKMLARCCIWVGGWADSTKIQNLENVLESAEQVCVRSVINSYVGSTLKFHLPPYRTGFS